ncbi:hypothetical protein PMAG_a0694 [Pseudoalteromonas mariniglutinosa NCIMB 1770]|nr:hypothetical protein [Pseudoalteromonas mariniglutinosa NCIMB 1770]
MKNRQVTKFMNYLDYGTATEDFIGLDDEMMVRILNRL